MSPPVRIAIVGLGPRGFFALERLVTMLGERRSQAPVRIDAFEPDHPATGPNYAVDQPDWLLLNYPLGHLAPWDDGPAAVESRSLMQWLERNRPDPHRRPTDLVPRAIVGHYLRACLDDVRAAAPAGVTITLRPETVIDLERDGHYRLRSDAGRTDAFDFVLIATGHASIHDAPGDDALHTLAANAGFHYVAAPYPLPAALEAIPAGAVVGMRGLGLSFLDCALALTEGRGGTFERDGAVWTYRRGGDEPARICGFSRSGLLPLPKSSGMWPERDRFEPTVLTDAAIDRAAAVRPGRRLAFTTDLWPLVVEEMQAAWSRVGGSGTLDVDRLMDPFEGFDGSGDAFHDATVERLVNAIDASEVGPERDPARAAIEVWSRAFPTIADRVAFGGLTASGYRDFARRVAPAMGRLAFGPPLRNAHKLLALARAGLVDFRHARGGTIDVRGDRAVLRARTLRSDSTTLDALVESRVAPESVDRTRSAVVRALVDRGIARPFEIRDPDGTTIRPGGLDVVTDACLVVDATGAPQSRLSCIGIPIEGTTIGNDSAARTRNRSGAHWARHVVDALRSTTTT